MKIFEAVLSDRGSKYAISGGPCQSKEGALAFLKNIRRKKKFAKATHNIWTVLLPDGTPLKNDDGESGVGMLECEIVVVTRWYGGTKLGGDRFRRVQDCVRYYSEHRGRSHASCRRRGV